MLQNDLVIQKKDGKKFKVAFLSKDIVGLNQIHFISGQSSEIIFYLKKDFDHKFKLI